MVLLAHLLIAVFYCRGSFRRELAFRCYLEVLGGGLEDFVSRRIMFSTGGVAVFLISDLDKVGGL